MSVHITKTYNIGGLTGLRQNAVRNAGEALGYKEMSLFRFPDRYDSDEELHVRMDGIISALCADDIVIFQHPSGESPRYDSFLFEHIRRYKGTKIISFIQDVASQMKDNEYSLEKEIELLNKSDIHIFASEALRKYYMDNGLEEKPFIIQTVPDYMTDMSVNKHNQHNIYMLADTQKKECPDIPINTNVIPYDEYHTTEMFMKISEGGMGLIWNMDVQALSIYMAAGIPVIVKEGLPCTDYVLSHGIGCVVKNADDIFNVFSPENNSNISQYYENVKKLRRLFTNAIYTKKLLLDVIIMTVDKL